MNDNITLKGKVFNRVYSDKAGSLRRSTTDGATLPHEMKISHSDAIDSRTKLATKRSVARFDLTHMDTSGVNPSPVPCTAYLVLSHGTGVNQPTSVVINLAIDMIRQLLATTSADASALALTDTVFVNKEQ